MFKWDFCYIIKGSKQNNIADLDDHDVQHVAMFHTQNST